MVISSISPRLESSTNGQQREAMALGEDRATLPEIRWWGCWGRLSQGTSKKSPKHIQEPVCPQSTSCILGCSLRRTDWQQRIRLGYETLAIHAILCMAPRRVLSKKQHQNKGRMSPTDITISRPRAEWLCYALQQPVLAKARYNTVFSKSD